MQKGCRCKRSIHDSVLRETTAKVIDSASEYALSGGIFAIAGTIRFDVDRQGQARSDNAGHHDMMLVAGNISFGILDGPTQPTTFRRTSGRGGTIDGDPDESRAIESFVPLGLS